MKIRPLPALFFAICATVSSSIAAPLELISKPFEPRPNSSGDSGAIELSADGQWAVFSSAGNGLVTNDDNGFNLDVFLRNLDTGETTLVSRNTNGVSGNGHSVGATISPDGRWVLYETEADNLAPDDDNEVSDVILYDRVSGVSSAIRPPTGFAEGASGAASMTADGRFILFETEAQGFSPLDTNESSDLYLLERETGTFHLVNVNSNNTAAASTPFPSVRGGMFESTMSADGRYVAFVSAGTNHIPGVPGNAAPQIYLRDTVNQTNAWLSRPTNGAASTAVSSPVVSTDGAFVAFLSADLEGPTFPGTPPTHLYIFDLATGTRTRAAQSVDEFALSETGGFIAYGASNQVYLLDLAAGTRQLVSRTSTGSPGDSFSSTPQISSDGRRVIFTSVSTNLTGNATDEYFQLYSFDRETALVRFLSRATDRSGGGDADVIYPVLSGDGLKAGFMSYASNLATNDNPLANDVFAVSTSGAESVALVSVAHPGAVMSTAAGSSSLEGQALSLDGRRLIFVSQARDIVRNDLNEARDIFLRDLVTGVTRVISGDPSGTPYPGSASLVGASLDGNIIAFIVTDSVEGESRRTLYSHNVATGTNMPAGILPTGVPAATIGDVILSPDGRYLAFRESATVATGPLYIRDLQNEVTVRYSVPFTIGTQPVAFSPGNRFLLTRASSLLSIFEWQLNRVVTTNFTILTVPANAIPADESRLLVEVRGASSAEFNLNLYPLDGSTTNTIIATNTSFSALSLDGSTVVYQGRSANSNAFTLHFYDVASGVVTPLTLGGTNVDLRIRSAPSLSADGRFIAFSSTNAFTVGGDENSFTDVFVYDRILKTVRLVSQSLTGGGGEFGSGSANISADGRVVAFDSAAPDLVANDGNFNSDVFLARLEPVDTDADGLEDGWETIHFGGLTGTADADTDSDGVSNRDEALAGTNPNSAASKFALEIESGAEGIALSTSAVIGRSYQLQHRANLANGEWQNIGQPTVAFSNSVSITVPTSASPSFFRFFVE